MTAPKSDPTSPLQGFLGNLPQDMNARMKAAALYRHKTFLFKDNYDATGQDAPYLRVKDGFNPLRHV